ncbi:CCA tRNA nucleotidyltransferase [Bacillus manliponensis]|uniref:CCA tRNA nucleotidyltransferase n=1 Tax=Bacillus manliponensis TaxID=574376 RepID=UPI003510DFE3
MERFKEAASIINTLKGNGFEAYFVGGSVRDYIIGREIGDIDIATSALPEDVMRIFPRNVPVGLEHGTVIVLQGEIPYEVTTFRTESDYEDFRRPSSVQFVRSLQEDLQRRDFTMNAIAMTEMGEIIDLFGGKQAIEKKEIVTVGSAADRFQEDALRMMRAIRFVSSLGFTLDEAAKTAIIEHAYLLEHIAMERIVIEFEKMLLGTHCDKALHLFVETALYKHIPHLQTVRDGILQATQHKFNFLQNDIEAWAFFLYCTKVENPATFLRDWKFSNKKAKGILSVLAAVNLRKTEKWQALSLYKAGKETAVMTERVYEMLTSSYDNDAVQNVQKLYDSLPIFNRKELKVGGTDLLEWKSEGAGPWVAQLLQKVEEAVVEGRLENEKGCIKEWLQICNLL